MKRLNDREWKRLWKAKPTASSDCVVVRGDEVALVKRDTKPFRGYWTLPGGLMDNGESIEQTALREVKEETGIKGRIISLIGVYSSPGRDPRGTSLSVAFLIKFVKFAGKPDLENSEVRFFPMNKIPKKLGFDHLLIVKDALRCYKKMKNK
ncbi:MAG: 7,8-dihydro-8-oxoguanine triphosphatase [archaeon GW2011_AR5]|nr:MAG: 7,8-dihydro-8-oxoguanine triphosphatase [archaeon GW2011_AR5]